MIAERLDGAFSTDFCRVGGGRGLAGDWFEGYWFGSPVDVMGSPELGQVTKARDLH